MVLALDFGMTKAIIARRQPAEGASLHARDDAVSWDERPVRSICSAPAVRLMVQCGRQRAEEVTGVRPKTNNNRRSNDYQRHDDLRAQNASPEEGSAFVLRRDTSPNSRDYLDGARAPDAVSSGEGAAPFHIHRDCVHRRLLRTPPAPASYRAVSSSANGASARRRPPVAALGGNAVVA